MSIERGINGSRQHRDSSLGLNGDNDLPMVARKRKKDDKIPFTPEVSMHNNAENYIINMII